MSRVNISIPDLLARRVREQLPGLNLSATLREALAAKLSCDHHDLECSVCAALVDRRVLVDELLSQFYGDAQWELDELVRKVGTAEGAQRVLKRVAEQWGLSAASRVQLSRPTRENRRAALEAKLAQLPPAGAAAARRRRRVA